MTRKNCGKDSELLLKKIGETALLKSFSFFPFFSFFYLAYIIFLYFITFFYYFSLKTKMEPLIVSVYAWTYHMPGCSISGQLMCSIKFNVKVKDMIINSLTLSNAQNQKYSHDLTIIDGDKYEHRDKEIIMRRGPKWLEHEFTAEIAVNYENKDYVLTSELIQVETVY